MSDDVTNADKKQGKSVVRTPSMHGPWYPDTVRVWVRRRDGDVTLVYCNGQFVRGFVGPVPSPGVPGE